MSVAWSAFATPYINSDVPKVNVTIAGIAARQAAIEFCERTKLWFIRSEASSLFTGKSIYGFDTPQHTVMVQDGIFMLEVLELDGSGNLSKRVEIEPRTYTDLIRERPGFTTDTDEYPEFFWVRGDGLVQVTPTPTQDKTGVLYADIAVKPSPASTMSPQFLYDHYAPVIAAGAKAILLGSKGEPWEDQAKAMQYRDQFENNINSAAVARIKSNTRKAPAAKAPAAYGRL